MGVGDGGAGALRRGICHGGAAEDCFRKCFGGGASVCFDECRDKEQRDGRFIEILGTYDPKQEGENYKLDLDRAEYWVGVGARPSQTVGSIINKARKQTQPA